jgi:hypothetical protein
MQPPMTRAEFEHRFHLLKEQIRRGQMHFASGTTSGIEKIRFLPNGRIDFLSVNESARLQANMQLQFQSEAFRAIIESSGNQDTPEK